jgi:hypothetical protein
VRDLPETGGDVRLGDPSPAIPRLIDEDLERVVLRPLGPKPKRARQEVRLEDRLNDDPRGGLHDAVADSRNRQWPLLGRPAGLRNEHPASRERPVAAVPQIRGQLVKQPVNPVLLDVGDGLSVDAGRAPIGAHRLPRPLQDVPAVDLVIERMEPASGIGLGRPVERSL